MAFNSTIIPETPPINNVINTVQQNTGNGKRKFFKLFELTGIFKQTMLPVNTKAWLVEWGSSLKGRFRYGISK